MANNNGIYHPPVIKAHEFEWIKDYLYKKAGIVLNESKHAMVCGRLDKRLRHYSLRSYSEYFSLLNSSEYAHEAKLAIDLLTTNETYFFREAKHFDFMLETILAQHQPGKPFRVWSAASSSGEEAYTIAMLLADYTKINDWEIIGTDISSRILEKARNGLYPLNASEKIPQHLLKKYCLKGSDDFEGFLLIEPKLRKQVKFLYANLLENLPEIGKFEIIFLRNVMIYFDLPTKQRLVQRIQDYLQPNGYFIISHSESLNGIKNSLQMIAPSIYKKSN